MRTPLENLLHKIDNQDLNILTFPTHERYETNLCKTGFTFFAYRHPSVKDWNTDYAELPENYILLDKDLEIAQIPDWCGIDIILSQNKFGQYQLAANVGRQLQLPVVSLEHTLPVPSWEDEHIKNLTAMQGHRNVYISEYSMQEWGGSGDVIHHGVDSEIFHDMGLPRDGNITVVNDFINRDWCCGYKIWTEVTNELNRTVVGNTPGLSESASSIEDLVTKYNQHLVYINTSTISPVPTALLESMACGCCPVSTATCMIPEIIEDGVNGFISNNPEVLRNHLIRLMENPDEAIAIGKKARETVVQKFGVDAFVNNWRTLLLEAAQIPYRGEFHV